MFIFFENILDNFKIKFLIFKDEGNEGLQPEVENGQYNFISTEITAAITTTAGNAEAPKFSF